MASTQPLAKQTSRWGSLLQQAVAGVESRLDNILADGDDVTPAKTTDEKASRKSPLPETIPVGSAPRAENAHSQLSSSIRTNERLQERLARAVAHPNNIATKGSIPAPFEPPYRAGSPLAEVDYSGEPESCKETPQLPYNISAQEVSLMDNAAPQKSSELDPTGLFTHSITNSRPSVESIPISLQENDLTKASNPQKLETFQNGTLTPLKLPIEYDKLYRQLRSENQDLQTRRQDENHSYIEQIDALRSKLQYLAKENSESARAAAKLAPSSSTERKMAEKDEQIALLMEEGQKLSKIELKHTNTIKNLRVQISRYENDLSEARKKLKQAEKDALDSREMLIRAEALEKRENEHIKLILKMEKELENVRIARDSNAATVGNLKLQLSLAISRAEGVEEKSNIEALQAERKLVQELRDAVSNSDIEKELVEGRARAEIRRLKEEAEQERANARVLELELRGEQALLESKLEVLRARVEESSTGMTGDAQAKLLRQIETLQSQYSVANENWQGIEGSLLSRLTVLEKERDEIAKREGDARRKVRELNPKLRHAEEELESLTRKLQDTEKEVFNYRKEAEYRLSILEKGLADSKSKFEAERKQQQSELQSRIEEEKYKWQEPLVQSSDNYTSSRNQSPSNTRRKSSAADLPIFQVRRTIPSRPYTGDVLSVTTGGERSPNTRRSSVQPSSLHRQDSLTSIRQILPPTNDNQTLETSSMHGVGKDDAEDYFEGFHPSTSPLHRTINDMISVSTIGAGPSVQLVERMSAAVRRLESEKASTREELVRLAGQRDEAREEVVGLMCEVESKRVADQRAEKLERELQMLEARYQTALEMLGEKSELVEELKADVADIKTMYRELVDRTMK
ncbi:MAG: hypothetical protein M1829_000701 [Trizodia sp. TS-e1964]|nr:MAG: hypothetical protein M1829_000701 [Trizodia sp. TS-e1964]